MGMDKQEKIIKARATLVSKIPYLDYNYGRYHALTRAAVAGDLEAFLGAGKHETHLTDFCVSDLCDIAAEAMRGAA